jgi:ATP-dependent DNA helicase RecQ
VPEAVLDRERLEHVRHWMRGAINVIEPRKLWPAGVAGRKGRIVGAELGRAIAYADDPAWPEVIADVARRTAGPDSLAGALRVLGQWRTEWASRPTVVVPLPEPGWTRYSLELAIAIGEAGKLPVADVLDWNGGPVVGDLSSGVRLRELTSRLKVHPGAGLDGTVLLVSAGYRSGWTVTLAAALLREAGAQRVLPLVAHQQP